MEPSWEEALDADDSDLLSLTVLRPCKQQRRHDESNPSTNTCLSLSQTLDSSKSPSQTFNSLPRTIPGPAGIVQAAKLRKNRDNENLIGQEEPPMATQEYIRRVVEDPEEDADFQCSPWLSAIEFVYGDGMFSSVPNAPLGDINKYLKNGKLDQVVAVIKSCTPNELGDLMVTLKDPTGAVSGTIHHKLLTEGKFGKGIFVGSVLILQKVSVFSPSRSAHYLNITKRNLVKLFYADNGSSQKQTLQGCKIIDETPVSDPGQGATTILGSRSSLEQIVKKMAKVTKTSTNSEEKSQENVNPVVSSGPQSMETFKESNVIKSGGVHENWASGNGLKGTGPVQVQVEPATINGSILVGPVQVQVEPAMISGSLPVWTDEQLNELFDDLADDF